MARPSARTSTRRQILAERTREDILLATARAVAQSGFKAVSMQDIASEVGLTAPALYAYFASKEQIFAELLALVTRELFDIFDKPVPRGSTFQQALAWLLRRQLELADRRRDVFLAFFALQM